MPVDSRHFVQGMRKLAAGVTVITTVLDGRRAGLTATAVCSVSADPPQLLICVNRSAEAYPLIAASKVFAVNVLCTAQRPIAERFSGMHGHVGEDRFGDGSWSTMATGAPVLTGCSAAFDCRVTATIDAGTHAIFLATVEGEEDHPELRPIVYHEGEFGMVQRIDA